MNFRPPYSPLCRMVLRRISVRLLDSTARQRQSRHLKPGACHQRYFSVSSSSSASARPPPPPPPLKQFFDDRADTQWQALAGKRLALFFDGDMVGASAAVRIVSRFKEAGVHVQVARMYTTAHRAKLWENDLSLSGISLVVPDRMLGGSKDPVDIDLAMDALELALVSTCRSSDVSGSLQPRGERDIDAVAIAAKDVDFAAVHRRIRHLGVASYVVSYISRGQPQMTPPDALTAAAAGVLYVQEIASDTPAKSDLREMTNEVIHRLSALLYMPAESDMLFRSAVALFAEENKLSGFEEQFAPYADPRAFLPALHNLLLDRPMKSWKLRPRGILCIEGVTNKKTVNSVGKQSHNRNWPGVYAVVPVSPRLVEDVLTQLRFLDTELNADLNEAVAAFLNANTYGAQATLATRLLTETDCLQARMHYLHNAIVNEHVAPRWRLPRPDKGVIGTLVDEKLLPNSDADPQRVLHAMQEYLRSRGVRPAKTYNLCVWHCGDSMTAARDHCKRTKGASL
eukprot:TRINITY_DN80117_c0_g1_i1.p1 TRINITY_DN80117_c0_g1~~TRINITY_DN80117_c0_g1_i1.p1  ORF type:complete len:512 (-),score=67.24 TRINITY_DN80117_c0_g1_i1:483-2018(-)